MIVCVDVDYRDRETVTACVGVDAWTDERPRFERVVRATELPAPYHPGRFYERELPHVLGILAAVGGEGPIDAVVVDGYVWLATERPGLGARLFDALARRTPVVGVAKTPFRDNDAAVEVRRGASARPLWVTAAGVDVANAARDVARMHGPHRLPTILKRVDRLARDA